MPFRIGLALYPVVLLLAVRARKGPLERFVARGATSPAAAVRPANLGIGDFRLLHDFLNEGLLVSAGDGLYYVDLPRYHRRNARLWALTAAVLAPLFALLVWMLW